MTAYQLLSTMESARTSWKLSASDTMTKRQLLFIADMLRARLLIDRRKRDPQMFESAAQPLPVITPQKDTSNVFGAGVPASFVGPIPRPVGGRTTPGFTFIGILGEEPLQCYTRAGIFHRRGARQTAHSPCAMWEPSTRKLIFNEKDAALPIKRRIEGVFLHPMEVVDFVPNATPGQRPPMRVNPFDFEYPFPGELVGTLLEMASQLQSLSQLEPDTERDDDQPSAGAGRRA